MEKGNNKIDVKLCVAVDTANKNYLDRSKAEKEEKAASIKKNRLDELER